MSNPSPHSRMLAAAFALTAVVALPACTVEAGDEAAHAIAEKFAADAEPKSVPEALPPTVSQGSRPDAVAPGVPVAPATHMTASPAASPPPKAAKPVARSAKDAEARKRAAAKADAARLAREQREADERDMLARARAEAEERRLEKERRLQEIERAEAEAAAEAERAEMRRIAEREEARRAAEARRLAEEKAAEQRRAEEEARRLAAQAEADERRAAEIRRLAMEDDVRRAAEERRLVEKRQREEEERQAALGRMAAERARAEDEARRAAEARVLAELAEIRRKAEDERVARERAENEERERVAALDRIARQNMERLAAEREEEARLLSEKLRMAREARRDRDGAMSGLSSLGGPEWQQGEPAQGGDDIRASGTRVTVLLVMHPGSRGIRRFNRTADPILCVNGDCYVSRGASEPSSIMGRGRAFGPGVALGGRAGLCSNSLTCVFRDVDLEGSSAHVQPIDLRILRHDRREPTMVQADSSCRLIAGRLSCRRPVVAGSYMLWVVPEALAERAGGAALEAAVQSGLAVDRVANF